MMLPMLLFRFRADAESLFFAVLPCCHAAGTPRRILAIADVFRCYAAMFTPRHDVAAADTPLFSLLFSRTL